MTAAHRLGVCLLVLTAGACGSRTSVDPGGEPSCVVGCESSCEHIAWTIDDADRSEFVPVGDRLTELRIDRGSGLFATAFDPRGGRSVLEFEVAWPGTAALGVGHDITGALAASQEFSLWLVADEGFAHAISRLHAGSGEVSTATHPWRRRLAPVGERYGAYGFSVTERSAAYYEWLSTHPRTEEVTLFALVESSGEWAVDFQQRVPINGWACGVPPLPTLDGWMTSCLQPTVAEARGMRWEMLRVTRDEVRTEAQHDLTAWGIWPDLHTDTGTFVTTQQSLLVGSVPTVAANVAVGGRRSVVLLRSTGDDVERAVVEQFDPEQFVDHVTASALLGLDGVAIAYVVTPRRLRPHLRLVVVRHSSGETEGMWDLPLEPGRVESVSVSLGVGSTTAVVRQRPEPDAPSRATVLSACHSLRP